MHFTYANFGPDGDLEQGDIIAPTDELKEVLRTVHPYFCNDKYLGFMVATQSCDLVRRRGELKAAYVSIAAIRSLRGVLPDLFSEVATSVRPGMFLSSTRAAARQFLARLFDQNEQSLGLFYLHPDAAISLGEPAVAFLRIKVALRAEHYGLLQRARTGRLSSEFRAKFGWLLGNLYARAASPDWSDQPNGVSDVAKLIDKHLEEQDPGRGPKWVEDLLVQEGRKANVAFADEAKSHEQLIQELDQYRPKASKDALREVAAEVLTQMLKAAPNRGGPATTVEVDPSRETAVAPTPSILLTQEEIDSFAGKFGQRLANNGRITKLLK